MVRGETGEERRRKPRSNLLSRWLPQIAVSIVISLEGSARAQQPTPPAPSTPSVSTEALPVTNQELLQELHRLRSEVDAARQLTDEVRSLRSEVESLRLGGAGLGSAASTGAPGTVGGGTAGSGGGLRGLPDVYQSGAAGPETPEPPDADRYPLQARYKYNHNATGPLGGGGYFSFSALDDEFTLNITNQITVDGTFFDRQNMPTSEQGFNIPFARTFFYGNVTKDFSYQIGTQGFLGTYNLLDLWMSWHINDYVTMRAGKGLTPPVYEYYSFSPALEPVIANSPMFQLAAKRPIGVMFSGMLFNQRLQWWAGVTDSGTSFFGNLDRNVDGNGAFDVTPFRGDAWTGSILEGLGGGVGASTGQQEYALHQPGIAFTNNGEATTNPVFVTPVGIPFFVFNQNIWAMGNRTRVAPHVYWFGRFSVLAEYINFSRELTDGRVSGQSTQTMYYVNLSYWLTGERDFVGNGFQSYSTIEPLRPFIPSRGEYGPGAWQLAGQWSEFNTGTADFARGFVDRTRSTTQNRNLQIGVNWWPNKYTRFSLDYVWTGFNNPIPINGPMPISQYNTAWFRFAMFF